MRGGKDDLNHEHIVDSVRAFGELVKNAESATQSKQITILIDASLKEFQTAVDRLNASTNLLVRANLGRPSRPLADAGILRKKRIRELLTRNIDILMRNLSNKRYHIDSFRTDSDPIVMRENILTFCSFVAEVNSFLARLRNVSKSFEAAALSSEEWTDWPKYEIQFSLAISSLLLDMHKLKSANVCHRTVCIECWRILSEDECRNALLESVAVFDEPLAQKFFYLIDDIFSRAKLRET